MHHGRQGKAFEHALHNPRAPDLCMVNPAQAFSRKIKEELVVQAFGGNNVPRNRV